MEDLRKCDPHTIELTRNNPYILTLTAHSDNLVYVFEINECGIFMLRQIKKSDLVYNISDEEIKFKTEKLNFEYLDNPCDIDGPTKESFSWVKFGFRYHDNKYYLITESEDGDQYILELLPNNRLKLINKTPLKDRMDAIRESLLHHTPHPQSFTGVYITLSDFMRIYKSATLEDMRKKLSLSF